MYLQVGMQQLIGLGQSLRERYGYRTDLGTRWLATKIQIASITSSNYLRTQQSAQVLN